MKELLGIEEQDDSFVGIMSNGTSGDLNTRNRMESQPSYAPYEKMKIVADDIAKEIYRVYNEIEHLDWVPLESIQTELSLNIRRADKNLLEFFDSILLLPTDMELRHRRERAQARYVMQLEKEWPDNISIPLQVHRIGDMAVGAIPFEVFAETGLDLKEHSPFKNYFTVELANGWYGYLPTPEQHKLGGWETWMGGSNKVEENSSELIKSEMLNLIKTLYNDL